jgi:hypothetical protein
MTTPCLGDGKFITPEAQWKQRVRERKVHSGALVQQVLSHNDAAYKSLEKLERAMHSKVCCHWYVSLVSYSTVAAGYIEHAALYILHVLFIENNTGLCSRSVRGPWQNVLLFRYTEKSYL